MTATSLSDVRVVFMGTPQFAVPSLNALVNTGVQVVGVVTQPDKPAGRGGKVFPSPVKVRTQELGIRLFQPKGLKKEENRKFLWELKPDLLVVAAYGKILPKEVLELPKFGAVNVHASLLPKYRGPSPITAAILHGDAETGVTIMKLDEGMDTGPLLEEDRVTIAPEDTTAALLPRLADLGARLLMKTLKPYLRGELFPAPQDETRATICPMLKKEDGLIDWTQPAEHIARMVRAYDPWPRTWTAWNGQRLIIRKAISANTPRRPEAAPGTVLQDTDGVRVATGEGTLLLQEVQREGRKPLPAEEFVRGCPHFVGALLALAREPVRQGK